MIIHLLYTHLHINFHTNIILLWIHNKNNKFDIYWFSYISYTIKLKIEKHESHYKPGELRHSGRVSSSCSTSDTCCVNLVTNPVISHEWGKDREVFMVSGTYPWSLVRYILSYIQSKIIYVILCRICNCNNMLGWY